MSKYISYLVVVLLFFIGILIGWHLKKFDDNFLPTRYEKDRFHSDKLNQEIYLKKKSFGMDGQTVVISTSYGDFNKPDYDNEYVMKGLKHIIYKFSNDTLFIYTMDKFKEPENFNSNIKIKQIEVEFSKFHDLVGEAQKSMKMF